MEAEPTAERNLTDRDSAFGNVEHLPDTNVIV